MENKILELIKLHSSNLQRNKQTELSLENEQLKLAHEIVKLFAIPVVVKSLPNKYCPQCGEPIKRPHKFWCEAKP